MNTVIVWARLLIFFVLAYSGHIFADEVRPAYLEISEKRDQNAPYAEILWKQPVVQDRIGDSRSIRFSMNRVT